MRQCCTDRNIFVTLTEINPIDSTESVEAWLHSLNLVEPFEHYKPLRDKRYGFLHFATRYDTCSFFQKYGNKKLEKGKDVRVMGSTDWNRKPISYNIGSSPPVANPEVNLLEVDIDNLYNKTHEHEAAIYLLRAEIRSKEGQIKRCKVSH